MSLLCEDPLAQGVFGPCDDLLFSGVSLDLEELFNDDALFSGAFLGCGDTLMAPSTAAAMPSACDQLLQPETCSSSDSRAAASRTTSSGGSSGMFRPSWDRPAQELASPAVVQLAVQRCAGPPTRKAPARGPVRMVPAVQQQMQQAAACNNAASQFVAAAGMVAAASAGALLSKPAERLAALLASGDDMSDSDSDASNDTEEGALGHSKKPTNKRKAPEIDWRSITDPSERRRQRRLAKNRMTAARSRERKKVQWADMEAKLANLDNDNKRLKAMLQQLASENSTLRGQLEGMGVVQASAPGRQGKGHSHSTEPAALVFISILLLLCCALPGERAMLLGSAAPILLLAQLLSQTKKANCSSGEPSQQSLAATLLHFLASIKLLLARASAKLRTSVHNMLYRRHHYVGRRVLRATADWASSSKTWLPKGQAAGDRGPLTPVVKEEEVLLVSASPLVKIEPVDTPMFDPCSFLVSSLLN